ncbi:MAG: helix-turn-helix domain-containing protein [Treponema sp.]|jgi:DNA-binding LacI/PurR family transcriptional regulator/AraC-like DNA-binding protein|nr:helix-turn-helix domain-containing protein [Treponema sp.]
MSGSGKKRIGLALASIHTGSARNVWATFAREAAGDMNLFIFPGGVLNALPDLEYLRNPIYSLLNPRNIDGLVVWSSSIGGTVSPGEFLDFHRPFESLPYITIAHKIPGRPCVKFDAYRGMKDLVSHYIAFHGARKIAFLRGPLSHLSSQERFRAYRDALADAGLPYDEGLVSDPVDWTQGAAACAQLVSARGLLPGRDFDALIGSSDLMILPAVQYISLLGYQVPADYRAGGFNDTIEGRILSPPLTTVHLPYAGMAGESFRILRELFSAKFQDQKGWEDGRDADLSCAVIIRGSCGCPARNFPGLEEGEIERIAAPLVQALRESPEPAFLDLFQKTFTAFLDSGGDAGTFLAVIQRIRGVVEAETDGSARLADGLFGIAARAQEHTYTYSRYQLEKRHTALNSLKCELLGTRDRRALIESLARHLPGIGIMTAAVVLSEDHRISECMGSFSPKGIVPGDGRRFPAERLLPPELEGQYTQGTFLVQPLFIENRFLGHFVHHVPFYDGVILEELRSTVSNALKGIFLFEEAYRAKQIAERAERAKTEFLAAIGNSLYDPFAEIIEEIGRLESWLGDAKSGRPSGPEAAALEERIGALKSLAIRRQERTNYLMELSLSQIDELSFKKGLFRIADLLPDLGPGPFPLLAGDAARLQDAFALIREIYGGGVSASLRPGGLEINFSAPALPEASSRHTLLLAERIILLHQGELAWNREGCSVLLPWTSYSGQDAGRAAKERNRYILALSPLPVNLGALFGLPLTRDLEKASAAQTAVIAWDADAEGWEGFEKAAALGSLPDFFHTPFLCFGRSLSGETLGAAVEARIRGEKDRAVLFIGVGEKLFSSWVEPDRRLHISSASELAGAAARVLPSLIVLGSVDIEAVNTVRSHPATAMIPLIVVPQRIGGLREVTKLGRFPRVVLCHRRVAGSAEFGARARAIAAGDDILPIYTGTLVKKALLYFDEHAESHISRWKLADTVNVSEDYLTRIFHREMGCSLWEYLNLYRVYLAADLLTRTGDTIYEIAARAGFQDQAYFCRVFKKIYGKTPGQLRSAKKAPKPQS